MVTVMIRFKTVQNISLGFLFEKKECGDPSEPPVVNFEIAMATPLLGFDENGEYVLAERYMFIDDSGNHVEQFHDASMIGSGSLFPSLYPEIHGDLNYIISFYNEACFERHQLLGFLEIMSSSFFEEIYNEILQGVE
jgi:hypothetical protein